LQKPSEIEVGFGVGDHFFVVLTKDKLGSIWDIFVLLTILILNHFLERIDVNHLYE
jgi:hypothetical protein